jgi:hypothetical protein
LEDVADGLPVRVLDVVPDRVTDGVLDGVTDGVTVRVELNDAPDDGVPV